MFRYIFPLLLLLMVGCSTKVSTDYDPAFATHSLRTFAVVHPSATGANTLDDGRLSEAITREMLRKGYEAAAADTADFHIDFRTAVEEDVPSNVSFGFGFGTYSGGVGTSVGTSHNVAGDEERIDINMVDPKTGKTFWRAALTKKRRDFKSPRQRSDYLNKTVASMLKEFPARSNGQ